MISKPKKVFILQLSWFIALAIGAIFSVSWHLEINKNISQEFSTLEKIREYDELSFEISSNLRSILNGRMSTLVITRNLAHELEEKAEIWINSTELIDSPSSEFNDSLRFEVLSKNKSLLTFVDLTLNKRLSVKTDKDVVLGRLQKLSEEIHQTNLGAENWVLGEIYYSNENLANWRLITTGLALFFALSFWRIWMVPIRQKSEYLQHKYGNWKKHESVAKKSKNDATLLNQKLSVKVAQVKKLQESLELAIAYSNKSQRDKNLIYYNLATDLNEYLKVIQSQIPIIENHINIAQNENWLTLRNTISQLNSMTGNYFQQAKNGASAKQYKNIYLSQFVSEILVSINPQKHISFNQASDMPQIQTDAGLLKRVLTPFLQQMSLGDLPKNITYSAFEDGDFCEFKFIGLNSEFEQVLNDLNQKVLSDYSFEEFNLYMACKSIEERGGKYWVQFNRGETGMLIINWKV